MFIMVYASWLTLLDFEQLFTIVMAAEITVHVSFRLTHGTMCYLHTNIPIDDYHSHMSIL